MRKSKKSNTTQNPDELSNRILKLMRTKYQEKGFFASVFFSSGSKEPSPTKKKPRS